MVCRRNHSCSELACCTESLRTLYTTGDCSGIARQIRCASGELDDILSTSGRNEVLTEGSAFRSSCRITRLISAHRSSMGNFTCSDASTARIRCDFGISCKCLAKLGCICLAFAGSRRSICTPEDTLLYTCNSRIMSVDHARYLIAGGTGYRYRHTIFTCEMSALLHAARHPGGNRRYFIGIRNATGLFCSTFRIHSAGEYAHVLGRSIGIGYNVVTSRCTCQIRMRFMSLRTGSSISSHRITRIRIKAASTLLGAHATEDRCIIEGTAAFTAGHLIPLAAVRCSHNTVRHIGFLILRCAVHIDLGLLAIGRCGGGTDMTTGDLRPLHLETLHMGHVVTEGTVCNVTGNGTGGARRTGCNRRDGLAIERRTISGSNTAKSTSHEASAAAETHTGTALHDRVTDIGVGIEPGCKACSKAACRCAGSGCSSTSTGTAKDAASRSCSTSHAGNDPRCHHEFHTHAGAGLGHIQAHGSQIAVKPLGALQIGQCTEQPEENTSLAGCQRTAVADELSHGGRETSEEPDIHHQQKQLGTNHTAPGLEDVSGTLGGAHGKCQRRSVAKNAHNNIPFYRFKQELEVIPAQCDQQDQDQNKAHHAGR